MDSWLEHEEIILLVFVIAIALAGDRLAGFEARCRSLNGSAGGRARAIALRTRRSLRRAAAWCVLRIVSGADRRRPRDERADGRYASR